MGEITGGRIIFGPEGIEPLLGVTALESVGILVGVNNDGAGDLEWAAWTVACTGKVKPAKRVS